MNDQTNVEETQAPAWEAPVREAFTELLAATEKVNEMLKAQLGPVFEGLDESTPLLVKPYVRNDGLSFEFDFEPDTGGDEEEGEELVGVFIGALQEYIAKEQPALESD